MNRFSLTTFEKQYDVDGDGVLDEAEKRIMAKDKSRKGYLKSEDLVEIAKEGEEAKVMLVSMTKITKSLVFGLLIQAIAISISIWLAVHFSKELAEDDEGYLVAFGTGKPVVVKGQQYIFSVGEVDMFGKSSSCVPMTEITSLVSRLKNQVHVNVGLVHEGSDEETPAQLVELETENMTDYGHKICISTADVTDYLCIHFDGDNNDCNQRKDGDDDNGQTRRLRGVFDEMSQDFEGGRRFLSGWGDGATANVQFQTEPEEIDDKLASHFTWSYSACKTPPTYLCKKNIVFKRFKKDSVHRSLINSIESDDYQFDSIQTFSEK